MWRTHNVTGTHRRHKLQPPKCANKHSIIYTDLRQHGTVNPLDCRVQQEVDHKSQISLQQINHECVTVCLRTGIQPCTCVVVSSLYSISVRVYICVCLFVSLYKSKGYTLTAPVLVPMASSLSLGSYAKALGLLGNPCSEH